MTTMIFHSRQSSEDRLVPSTVDNNSGWAWVCLFISLSMVAFLVMVRIFGKEKLYKYQVHDAFIFFACAVGLVVWIFWVISLANGLGQSFRVLDDKDISNTQLYFFLSYVFLNIPIALSKISFFMLVKSIFAKTKRIPGRVLGCTIGLIAVWCVAGSFVVLLSCSRATLLPKAGAEYCVDSKIGFTVIAALDCFIELIATALTIYGFSLNSNPWKYSIFLAWMVPVRLPNIACSIMHMRIYSKFVNERQPAIDIIPTFLLAITLLTFNLTSSILPLLRNLTLKVNSEGLTLPDYGLPVEAATPPCETNPSIRSSEGRSTSGRSINSQESQQPIIPKRRWDN